MREGGSLQIAWNVYRREEVGDMVRGEKEHGKGGADGEEDGAMERRSGD